jgi:zinc transporter 1/2/3
MMLEAGIIFHSVLVGLTTVVAGDSYYITLFIVILFHQAFEGVALGSRIAELRTVSVWIKILMGLGFAITTPLGMAIGIGTLNYFNGNDPSTVIAIGTLDALSAGVLLWVGIIEMLAHDWLYGPLAEAGIVKIATALIGLVGGMVLMSFLGKWT